ncbi:hypothetical protein Tco_1350635 [Tanacetum coccineum]
MAESSSQNPTSPEITPKEEPVTLDKPESPNPFLPAIQVEFTFEEIAFTTNNEVALLYPSHPNQEYFKDVLPDSKIWVSTPTGEVRGEIGITTFRNALRAQYLPHSSMYVSPPSITTCLGGKTGGLDQISNKDATILYCLANGVQVDYAKIIWEDLIHKLNKKTKEKIVPYPRFISLLLEHMAPKYDKEDLIINPIQVFSVHNWILKPKQPKEPPFTDHMKAICNLDVPVDSKAPKYSSPTKEVPQGKKPRARRSNLSVLVDKTKSARDGLKTAHTTSGANKKSRADDISRKVKLEDLLDILKDTRYAFFTPDSPADEPIIISDESEEEEDAETDKDAEDTSVPPPPSLKSTQIQELMAQVHLLLSQKKELEQAKVKAEAEVASMKANPLYPNINQLTKLLVTSLKLELSKLLASYDFASCLPTKLKELPSKITELSVEIKELKQHVRDMEIELPGDLVEIPTKLETLTISSLSSQIAKLENIQ